MKKKYSIGIVIVNYNGASYQNDCIESILNSTYQNFKIIVVDNASTDNSMELLKTIKDDRIVPIYLKENSGVVGGNNVGVKKSIELGLDATLLLNNDTILKENTIENLVKNLDEENVVAPLIYYWTKKDVFWYAGGGFDKFRGITKHHYLKKKDEGQKLKEYVDYASTCCLLVKNDVFGKIGFFDSVYFMYFDDTDFVMRLKMKGIKIKLEPSAKMYHKVSLSTGGEGSLLSTYYMTRNRFFFIKRYKSEFYWTAYAFTYWTRKIKYWKGLFTKSNDRCIKKAFKDYKAGKMGKAESFQ